MALLPAAFDHTTVSPATELGALPAGEYLVAITDSALEYTKAGDGQYLRLVFTVLDGVNKGAKIFDRLNLVNRNPTAVDIAQRALSAICHAIELRGVLQQSEQLHNQPLKVKVSYEPPKNGYSEQNRVKAYKPANEGITSGQVMPRASSAGPAAVSAAAPAAAPAASAAQNTYRQAKGGSSPSEAVARVAQPLQGAPRAIPPWKTAPSGKEAPDDDIPY